VKGGPLRRLVGAVAGRLERWRIIHGGVRDSVNLEFRKAVLNNMPVSDVRNLSGKPLQRFINNNCTGAPLTHYRVASDGMTMDSMQPATQTTFQPGYRWDLVTVFPQSGFYCVLDKSVPAAGAVNNEPPATTLVGIVEVGNGVNMNVTDIPSYVKQQMLNLANTNVPESVRANVVADLNDGLKLSRYTPHKTLTEADVTESTPQTVTYAILPPAQGGTGPRFTVDGKEFSETDAPRELKLGAVQDWDRGVIVGRRTFGKGLVQRPIPLPDNSMIRLTIARYYTPGGRNIQKPYTGGDAAAYNRDLIDRYNHGELMNADSIHFPDSLRSRTLVNHRTVYGGGGIMPDRFIPLDTSRYTDYHRRLVGLGYIYRTVLSYVDGHRKALRKRYPDFKSFSQQFTVGDELLSDLCARATADSVAFDSAQYAKSRPLIALQLKALIARDLFDETAYYRIINEDNESLREALRIINNAEAYEKILRGVKSDK